MKSDPGDRLVIDVKVVRPARHTQQNLAQNRQIFNIACVDRRLGGCPFGQKFNGGIRVKDNVSINTVKTCILA